MTRRQALFWSAGLLAVVVAGGVIAGHRALQVPTRSASAARVAPIQPALCAGQASLVLVAAALDETEDDSDGDDVQVLATVPLPASPSREFARAAAPPRQKSRTLNALRIRLQI